MIICIFYNFQIRQIPSSHKTFSFWKKPTVVLVKISKKKISGLRSCYHRQANRKKLILPLKITLKLWRTWSLALPVHNFLSHLHFFKVGEMLLKYANPQHYILDLYRIQLSNSAPFCIKRKHIESFKFRCKTQKFCCHFFQKSVLSGQYRMLP